MAGRKITIAIDGYSSCGKSTLAKSLAISLDYTYVDTGAMYRAITLFCMRQNLVNNNGVDESRIIEKLNDISLAFIQDPETNTSPIFLNGENVESQIRKMDVSNQVSQISAIREVRKKMVQIQQKMGIAKGVVMEGRDIGTIVFPDAELKLFMTADMETRVKRRYKEMREKKIDVSMDEVRDNVNSRDYEDTHRQESPLIQADDAIVLDNTNLDLEQQLQIALELVEKKIEILG
ncbi:MAG TPA: (d)CMP kinase [Flavobacteriales bacterium]|nr:(d)CMP kinase [Flavobacteriales bacterium]HIA11866.1 (d)CMP kinase [Flavobacteriales bacterium]